MKTVTIRLEDDMKSELDRMLESMGMSIATFYNLYTVRAIRDRKIPFEITAAEDPFYSETNTKQIKKSLSQVKSGKVVKKTMKELENMAK